MYVTVKLLMHVHVMHCDFVFSIGYYSVNKLMSDFMEKQFIVL